MPPRSRNGLSDGVGWLQMMGEEKGWPRPAAPEHRSTRIRPSPKSGGPANI
jgi:hypothetical protein